MSKMIVKAHKMQRKNAGLIKEVDWCIDEFRAIAEDPNTTQKDREEAIEYLMQSMAIKCVLSLPKKKK